MYDCAMQAQTIKMMYGVIADALRDVGKLGELHPRDYLNFYCLGNRETKSEVEAKADPPAKAPAPETKHVSSKKWFSNSPFVLIRPSCEEDSRL